MSIAAKTAMRSPSKSVKLPLPVGLKYTMRSASPSMLTHLQGIMVSPKSRCYVEADIQTVSSVFHFDCFTHNDVFC